MSRTYEENCHAIQSAIALRVERLTPNEAGVSPKHLRVGLDLRAADAKAMADLLIEKGIFTADEYIKAVHKATAEEAEYQAQTTRERLGLPSTVSFG